MLLAVLVMVPKEAFGFVVVLPQLPLKLLSDGWFGKLKDSKRN
jgi:hypothetical protein